MAVSNRRVATLVAGIAVGMFALAYASVPLYRLFCQVTGYGGTTQRAETAPDHAIDRWMTVSFNADVAPDLPWSFRPAERSVWVRVGEPVLIRYVAENLGREAVVGTATFNVTPSKIGAYFTKLECFCFTEQVLKPGEKVEMPVTFFLDPDLAKDRHLDGLGAVTLSYSFFRAKSQEGARTVAAAPGPLGPEVN
ncbi:MAG: cytochrome c oxidase assembly protein [Alphaproteobacteria bacterium]|nr:cytochrome c oxidase assembly protein [Alphaproteobacteria bacterium]